MGVQSIHHTDSMNVTDQYSNITAYTLHASSDSFSDGLQDDASGLSTPQKLIVWTSVFGIPGNIGAVVILLSDQQMRNKPVNIFMVHQSIIDLLACIVTILTVLYTDVNDVKQGASISD